MTGPAVCLQVRVIGRQVRVIVGQLLRIGRGPDAGGGVDTERCERAQQEHRHRHPEGLAHPTGDRVGEQPAGVRQGELRSEQGGAIF